MQPNQQFNTRSLPVPDSELSASVSLSSRRPCGCCFNTNSALTHTAKSPEEFQSLINGLVCNSLLTLALHAKASIPEMQGFLLSEFFPSVLEEVIDLMSKNNL